MRRPSRSEIQKGATALRRVGEPVGLELPILVPIPGLSGAALNTTASVHRHTSDGRGSRWAWTGSTSRGPRDRWWVIVAAQALRVVNHATRSPPTVTRARRPSCATAKILAGPVTMSAPFRLSDLLHCRMSRLRSALRTVAVCSILLLTLWSVASVGLYSAMRQPPETFGAIMAHVPSAAMILLPFKPLWMSARAGNLQVGDVAPDFTLPTLHGDRRVTLLSEYRHQPVVLIFGSYT